METNSRVVEVLNGLLTIELTAINQYFTHAKICESWGFERMAAKFREASMEEMKDAEAIMDRVLQLGGLPNLQRLESFQVGENVAEQLQLALTAGITRRSAGARSREHVRGAGRPGTSRPPARRRLLDEEAEPAWLEPQIELDGTLVDGDDLSGATGPRMRPQRRATNEVRRCCSRSILYV